MQNTSLAHCAQKHRKIMVCRSCTSVGTSAGKKLASLVFIFVLYAMLMGVNPAFALAKSYEMPQVNIQASVGADGSLHVVEERMFDFSGSFTCVWWEFNKLYGKELKPNGVEIGFVDDAPDGQNVRFESVPEVPFETLWRSEGGPGVNAYSLDAGYDTIYVFFDAQDTKMVVRLDYTIANAVEVYSDVAEVYWQYLGSGWAEDSHDVVCSIELPANGKTGEAGNTVRAWGHGPLSGKVALDETATHITYTVNRVKSGEFAEARIVFPPEWLALPAGYEVHDKTRLPAILDEEERWANEANRGRIATLTFFALLGIISLAAVLWAVVQFFRYGREYRPIFAEKYWRDVPNKNVHPAVISRLVNWNNEDSSDAVATLLHLANEGIVSLDWATHPAPQEGQTKGRHASDARSSKSEPAPVQFEEGYCLKLTEGAIDRLTNDIDKRLVEFLFGDIAENSNTLWLSDIATWGEAHKKSFNGKMEKWQNAVSRQVKAVNYFEKEGREKSDFASTLGWCLILLGIYLSVEMDNFWPVVFFTVAALFVFAFGYFMPRRSREGAEDYARSMALKRWLNDFTLLNERVPTDVKVWGEFMVYAQIFGVADKVVKQLRGVVPEMFATAQSSSWGTPGGTWIWWYDAPVTRSGARDTFGSAFENTWTKTSTSAAIAASAASSGSSGGFFSSGGGFGGGFSGGGGGGFGGGGGGAR